MELQVRNKESSPEFSCESIIVAPMYDHTSTVILLHDRDCSAEDFSVQFLETRASCGRALREIFSSTKWVFPIASVSHSTELKRPAAQWFDMGFVTEPHEMSELQHDGILESTIHIREVLAEEVKLIAPEKIVLGGLGQGCAVAVLALMTGKLRLGGFFGLGGWLPYSSHIKEIIRPNLTPSDINMLLFKTKLAQIRPLWMIAYPQGLVESIQTPVMFQHSLDDQVVAQPHGQEMAENLIDLEYDVWCDWFDDGGHWINQVEGVDSLVNFFSYVAGLWCPCRELLDWYRSNTRRVRVSKRRQIPYLQITSGEATDTQSACLQDQQRGNASTRI